MAQVISLLQGRLVPVVPSRQAIQPGLNQVDDRLMHASSSHAYSCFSWHLLQWPHQLACSGHPPILLKHLSTEANQWVALQLHKLHAWT
jgi:hypothetical protein